MARVHIGAGTGDLGDFMTAWDIVPSEVGAVLTRSGKAAEGLSKAGKGVQKSLPAAATDAGTISGMYCGNAPKGPVAAALAEFGSKWGKDLAYIAQRTADSLNGAQKATQAYMEGDLKMAADTQNAALKEPVIKMPGQGKK
ncbi:DUF6507 family protein [Streptomyces netropsis]|uniref:DUF6507 family protein n=1 Tax=Streptomyces netropsis TaxID=55404 RepID=UPI0030D4FE4C